MIGYSCANLIKVKCKIRQLFDLDVVYIIFKCLNTKSNVNNTKFINIIFDNCRKFYVMSLIKYTILPMYITELKY